MTDLCRLMIMATITWMAFVTPVWGCPNCGDALSEAGMARGFLASLAVLLMLPAVLFGGWGWVFWKQARRYRTEDQYQVPSSSEVI